MNDILFILHQITDPTMIKHFKLFYDILEIAHFLWTYCFLIDTFQTISYFLYVNFVVLEAFIKSKVNVYEGRSKLKACGTGKVWAESDWWDSFCDLFTQIQHHTIKYITDKQKDKEPFKASLKPDTSGLKVYR